MVLFNIALPPFLFNLILLRSNISCRGKQPKRQRETDRERQCAKERKKTMEEAMTGRRKKKRIKEKRN